MPKDPEEQGTNEQHVPYHSPVEEELEEEQPGDVDERAWYNLFGIGLSMLLAVVFIVFAVAVVVFLVIDAI